MDTSFLMIPGMFAVDILNELDRLLKRRYELVIPGPVLVELKEISKRDRSKEASAAKIALQLSRRWSVVEEEGKADEIIIKMASRRPCLVGTTDSDLRKNLRRMSIPVIYLRKKSHLELDGYFW